MNMRRALAMLTLVLLALAAAIAAAQRGRGRSTESQGASGGETVTFEHGGFQRNFILHLPSNLDRTRPAPLVLVLHGGGGAAAGTARFTGFNAIADREKFIVAYPDGMNRRWNDGRQSGAADRPAVDDVAFIAAVIERIERDHRVDPKRIYATGISNGGFMSQRLACDLSERIAAIGVVAATMGRDLAARCAPKQPVSLLLIAGTEDPLVPYEGGRVNVPGGGAIVSAEAAVAKWVALNGCKGRAEAAPLNDAKDDGTETLRELHTGCRRGTDVYFYKIAGGGHTWPGGPQYLPEGRIGRVARDFNASEEIWTFFATHPKQ